MFESSKYGCSFLPNSTTNKKISTFSFLQMNQLQLNLSNQNFLFGSLNFNSPHTQLPDAWNFRCQKMQAFLEILKMLKNAIKCYFRAYFHQHYDVGWCAL
eukprot:TRINITY_DN15191_c0_g1_i1.p3 TRINITY_DN15191_c0_g1~~TRINITY_DN15191_c0_g1_i1.p3  ORF type:complete len:100 (+),score=6.03 TRINITY_DN15191_c0_g1_i1:230-529(+)